MQLKNVSLGYLGHEVLTDVSVTFEGGSFTYITGKSGTGKSTLLKAMIGYVIPRSGSILDDRGNDLASFSKGQLQTHRRRCGFVYQDYQLIDYKTVEQNVAFGMQVCGYDNATIKSKVPDLLEKVGLAKKMNAYPHELSGGEQQRVAIARALIHDPEILLADEPTGNLDPEHTRAIVKLFEEINAGGTTIIFATHDQSILSKTTRKIYMVDGAKVGAYAKQPA